MGRNARTVGINCLIALLLIAWADAWSQPLDSGRRIHVISSSSSLPVSNSATFKDLHEFQSNVPCLKPGDSILLEQGRVFQGSLRLRECDGPSEGQKAPIVVRSFNPEAPFDADRAQANAVISPAVTAAHRNLTWQREVNPIYRGKPVRHLAGRALFKLGPLDHPVIQLIYNARPLPLASFPSEAASIRESRFVPFSGILEKKSGEFYSIRLRLTDAVDPEVLKRLRELDFADGPTTAGPFVIVRNSPWSLARSRIAGVEPDTLEIALRDPISGPERPATSLPSVGHGVILMNSFALLSGDREWFYNEQDRYVYLLWPDTAGDAPSARETRLVFQEDAGAVFADAGLAFSGLAGRADRDKTVNLVIRQITVDGSGGRGISVMHARNVRVERVEVLNANGSGISIFDAQEAVEISDSLISASAMNGIEVHSAAQIEVRSNRVLDSGRLSNQVRYEMDFSGIRASGFHKAVITGNRVERPGYAGIMLNEPTPEIGQSGGWALDVSGNTITGFCRMLNDCGAIYINGQGKDYHDPGSVVIGRKRIAGNTIMSPLGNMDGTPLVSGLAARSDIGDWDGSRRRVIGAVYLDQKASHYEIRDNTISGHYEPHSWKIFNQGINNTCSREVLDRCLGGEARDPAAKHYACYSQALDRCNTVTR